MCYCIHGIFNIICYNGYLAKIIHLAISLSYCLVRHSNYDNFIIMRDNTVLSNFCASTLILYVCSVEQRKCYSYHIDVNRNRIQMDHLSM